MPKLSFNTAPSFCLRLGTWVDGDGDADSGGDGHIDEEESVPIGLSVNKSCDIFRCDTFQERDVVCVSQTQIINCALRA